MNQNEPTQPINLNKKKSNSFLTSKVFGILFLVIGVITIFSDVLAGIIWLLMAAILLPFSIALIEKKTQIKVTKALKIIGVIIGLFLVGLTYDAPENTAETGSNSPKSNEYSHTEPANNTDNLVVDESSFTFDNYNWNILNISKTPTVGDSSNSKESNNDYFLVIEAEIENTSTRPQEYGALTLTSGSNSYEESKIVDEYAQYYFGYNSKRNNEFLPDVKEKTYFGFDVKASDHFTLELSSTSNNGQKAVIKLDNLIQKDTSTDTPVVAEKPTTPIVEEKTDTISQLWEAADRGIKSRKDLDIQYDEATKTATITYKPDAVWDDSAYVRKAYSYLVMFGLEAFKVEGVEIIEVILQGEMIDSYGKKTIEDAVDISFEKDEFNKYNWKDLEYMPVYDQMMRSARTYYVHPAVLKGVNYDDLFLVL